MYKMVFVKTKCPANSRSLGPKLEVTTISKYCWTILPEIFYLNTKSQGYSKTISHKEVTKLF